VAPLEVHRDDERQRIVALIGTDRARDASDGGCAVAVPAFENLPLEEPDRLADAVDANVGDQLVEIRPFEQRK
jgi:hypothetical protein